MKNVFKLIGKLTRAANAAKVPLVIVTLVLAIGFSMTACGDDSGGDPPSDGGNPGGKNPGENPGGDPGGGGTVPTITTSTLPNGMAGTAYNQSLMAIGDTPIIWTIDTGSLPDGLTLSTTGVISGKPTKANTFNFIVKASNTYGNIKKALSIVITSGKLTISGLQDGGTYIVNVFTAGTNISNFSAISTALNSNNNQAVGTSSSGNVFNLYVWDGSTTTTAWTGSGSLPVLLTSGSDTLFRYATVSFSNGVGTAQISSFTTVVIQ